MGAHNDDYDLDAITIVFDGGRLDLPDGFLPPPVRLAPLGQLAEAARAAPAMASLATVVEWVGKGRAVDDEGELEPAALQELARLLGVEAEEHDDWELSAARSEVALVVEWAVQAGLVYQRGRRLHRTRQGKQLGADPLAAWKSAFEALLDLGVVDLDGNGPPWAATVDAVMADLVVTAALRGGPIPQDELLVWLWAEEDDLLDDARHEPELQEQLRAAIAEDAGRTWKALADLGVVVVEDDCLASTPLGSWAAVELMRDDGLNVPVIDG